MSKNHITITAELLNGLSESSALPDLPNAEAFDQWLSVFDDLPAATLSELDNFLNRRYSISIRLVEAEEIRTLNRTYRQKDAPTNILSFPTDFPDMMAELSLVEDGWPLGDLAICASIVATEAAEQQKTTADHWAHLTLHGVLHLLGFDHQNDSEAEQMESLEIQLLAALGIDNPYISE